MGLGSLGSCSSHCCTGGRLHRDSVCWLLAGRFALEFDQYLNNKSAHALTSAIDTRRPTMLQSTLAFAPCARSSLHSQ